MYIYITYDVYHIYINKILCLSLYLYLIISLYPSFSPSFLETTLAPRPGATAQDQGLQAVGQRPDFFGQ